MSYKRLPRNVEIRIRVQKMKRQQFIRNCIRGAAKPWPIERIQLMGPWTMKGLHLHIGNIFPVILDLVATGHSIRTIEGLLSFKKHLLENVIKFYPQIKERVDAARAVKTDEIRLSKRMELLDESSLQAN
jgi:hypothetical protein